MRKEVITKCFVSYLNNGIQSIRTFQSEESMDRWVERFMADYNGDEDYYIEFKVVGFKALKMQDGCHIRVNRG